MPQLSEQQLIASTQAWLRTVVIGHNFCPFAQRELEQNRIRCSVNASPDWANGLQQLISECLLLDADPAITTTLIIFSQNLSHFDDYLDFLALAEQLLQAQGFHGTYQLASFHPDYCFEGASENDPANFTNRSPYPMLHLLREDSLASALRHYPQPEQIPERNIAVARQLGFAKMQALLRACYAAKG